MPSKTDIHKLIANMGRDPHLIDELLREPDEKNRKEILVKRGLLKRDDHPSRPEIMHEMLRLATPAEAPMPAPPGARVVEWVGAVAAAGAGAAAAACTGD